MTRLPLLPLTSAIKLMTHTKRFPLLAALVLAGCATTIPRENPAVAESMRDARGKATSPETQAALYLKAAADAAPRIGSGTQTTAARDTYNAAAAELAVLLRTADNGRLWNRPQTVSAGGSTYRLRFQPGDRHGVWAPDYFTSLVLARDVPEKSIKRRDVQEGIGGALVGVRKKTPREPFAPFVGVTAPVTATLDFQGPNATLTLRDPSEQPKARVAGATRPLNANLSAPLAYYPAPSELITGLMGAIKVSHYMDTTGLYMLQPYDPDRIPVIFVHGLISTARMWRNVVNEIETDPKLRGRFQAWVFNYPTGNPMAYSALRFREELAKVEKLHGFPHGFVLISHSMGGVVSQMQATTITRGDWDRVVGAPVENLLTRLPSDSLLHRAVIFDANPKLQRVVFICTPHRGSQMALAGIGQIGARLISLPGTIVGAVKDTVGSSLAAITGSDRIPNGVSGLSPKNPMLRVMDSVPIHAPYHSIIGNRGKPGPLADSSDGVVPYWSSHLDGAQSELIVPGPHGSCELPQTIEELKRILHLQLKTVGR